MAAAAAARSANSEVTVQQKAGSQFQRYEEVFESVNLSNEEFEAKIKSMKHLPPVVALNKITSKAREKKIPPTPRLEVNVKLALPPIVVTQQNALSKRRMSIPGQFQATYDKEADTDFYKEFKFTYVLAPTPAEEFPRK